MRLGFIGRKKEAQDVYSFFFQSEKPLKWQAGQYLHYELPHPNADKRGIGRWFTISAAPFEKHITLTTRFDSKPGSTFKKALLLLEPGAVVETGEPRGDFVYEPDASRLIFIAGGIGITPYRSMLLQLDHEDNRLNIDLLWVNRDNSFVFNEEMEGLAKKHPEFNLKKFIGDKRISRDDFKPYLADESILFYLSGPKPMVETYQQQLLELNVDLPRIKLDYFPGY